MNDTSTLQVKMGAITQCNLGTRPSNLNVWPVEGDISGELPVANILNNVPMLNIMPFGTCISRMNPQVDAASTAASGVLTPMPCIPVITTSWTPAASMKIVTNAPAIDCQSTCMCQHGGLISIKFL